MTSRGRTASVFALFGTVVSFFTVAAIALIVMGRHDDAVAEADSVAQSFAAATATYEEQTKGQLERLQGETDIAQVLQAVDSQLSMAPKLKRLTGYGPDNSSVYKQATKVRSSDFLWTLRETLEVALQEQTYVLETRKALLEPEAKVSSADDPFRDQTIPKLKSLQSGYEQISVPAAAEQADVKVRAVFDSLISGDTKTDGRADAPVDNRGKSKPTYDKAKSAVDKVEKNAHSKVAAALKSAANR